METHAGKMYQRWYSARETYLSLKKLKRSADAALEEAANVAGELLQLLNSGFPPPLWSYSEAIEFLEWNRYSIHAHFVLPAPVPRDQAEAEVEKTNVA